MLYFLSSDGFLCETARNEGCTLSVAKSSSLAEERLPLLPVPRAIPRGPEGPCCLLGIHGASGTIYTRFPVPPAASSQTLWTLQCPSQTGGCLPDWATGAYPLAFPCASMFFMCAWSFNPII